MSLTLSALSSKYLWLPSNIGTVVHVLNARQTDMMMLIVMMMMIMMMKRMKGGIVQSMVLISDGNSEQYVHA